MEKLTMFYAKCSTNSIQAKTLLSELARKFVSCWPWTLSVVKLRLNITAVKIIQLEVGVVMVLC